jgi:CheY-like chemotaxis protein
MGKTLLLADDSVTIQKVVGISFASEDIRLITVDNGDAAIARAREHRPDAILADVVMPGKNGYEVCAAIKADPALRHIPVLLLTGTFESFDEERARRCGAAGHVAKPFEAQALVERVRELLARAPEPAPEPAASEDATPAVAALSASGPATASADDSFDFFDDDLGDLSAPAEAERADAPLEDGAFAFGEDDLDGAAPAPPRSQGGPSFDRTLAMLPEDEETDAAPAATALDDELDVGMAPTRIDEDFGAPESDVDDLLGDSQAYGRESAPEADRFDFDFASDAPGGRAGASIGAADLAGATVLDPNGSSGFDISSSDLGEPPRRGSRTSAAPADSSPFGAPLDADFADSPALTPPPPARRPAAPAPPAPRPQAAPQRPQAPPPRQPAASPPQQPAASPPQQPAAVPPPRQPAAVPPPLPTAAAPPARAARPPAAQPTPGDPPRPFGAQPPPLPRRETQPAARGPSAAFDELSRPGSDLDDLDGFAAPVAEELDDLSGHARAGMRASEAVAADEPDFAFAALEEDDLPVATAEMDESSLEELGEDAPIDARRVGIHDPAALAGVALAEITPRLREQLHDTLEKVAWESLGDVAEQIVRQALERVEQIAWEVIPQMAETLVREEIRRMKGEED